MKRITVGILAHVDAGKTTCIESMLFNAGNLRKMGRVDHQDAFLDYDNQERDRGITIFSKEAMIQWKDTEIYLIDTPGHVDFSSEMERCLQILDIAIILINGQDGIQSHTETIWKCLQHYNVPTLLFINKMDISHLTKEELMNELTTRLCENCIDFESDDLNEKLALVNDEILNTYLETQTISLEQIQKAIYKRECFPCFFGSALKNQNIDILMDAIVKYTIDKSYPLEFGAKVYKISNDEQGNRLTHVKITSGTLKAKQKLSETEKVDQIRIYNGQQFQMINEAFAGMVCTLKGLTNFQAGQGIGIEKDSEAPLLNAYMNYQLLLPENVDALEMMRHLNILSQEDPNLKINYDEQTKKINLHLMGAIQIEVLQKLIETRTNIKVGFTTGAVVYKETIKDTVTGAGHFEPLRHYAEVHVRLEPLKQGSGLIFSNDLSADDLSLNWQHLIMTHMQEYEHKGVLTGSPITDMKITLIAGKGHTKHTEGGDFRQATYRAIRQGLKKAESILLEPYYQFELTLPTELMSKALYDLETKNANVEIQDNLNKTMTIHGKGPVKTMINYQKDVMAYTKGKGSYSCFLDGYYPCHDQDEVIEDINYDSESDLMNPTGSIFCSHGSGYYVNWDEADELMHIQPKKANGSSYQSVKYKVNEEELQRVFNTTGGRNKNEKKLPKKPKQKKELNLEKVSIQEHLPECLIVDGYNMIYSWDELKELSRFNIGTARDRLIDLIVNYQGYKNCKVILVFDAYRVKDNPQTTYHNSNTSIVYTKSSQTADSYIEKIVHDLKNKYRLIVATSDGLVQNAIFAQGASRMSARELEARVNNVNKQAFKHLTTF